VCVCVRVCVCVCVCVCVRVCVFVRILWMRHVVHTTIFLLLRQKAGVVCRRVNSRMNESWHIHECVMSHRSHYWEAKGCCCVGSRRLEAHVWHDYWICVAWLMHSCPIHVLMSCPIHVLMFYMRHVLYECMSHATHIHATFRLMHSYRTWRIDMCDANDSFISGMMHGYTWREYGVATVSWID